MNFINEVGIAQSLGNIFIDLNSYGLKVPPSTHFNKILEELHGAHHYNQNYFFDLLPFGKEKCEYLEPGEQVKPYLNFEIDKQLLGEEYVYGVAFTMFIDFPDGSTYTVGRKSFSQQVYFDDLYTIMCNAIREYKGINYAS